MVPPGEGGARISNTERNAIAEADEWLKHNQPIPHDWENLAECAV